MARLTYTERRWPDTPEFNSVLHALKAGGSTTLLQFVWKAYDRFCIEALREMDCSLGDEDLERDITEHLELMVSDMMTGYEPFWVEHAPFERESRQGGSAQPPQYDIAYKLRCNPRVMWPLEAKVLRTDGGVAEYVCGLKSNFLTCRYAPFSNEAAMIGYLLSGTPERALDNIATKGHWRLRRHQDFPNRQHRTSDHRRTVPQGKPYPVQFRCHHVLLLLVKP
ncbi:MAG: hypothetical protein A2Y77_16245 [Planctomycetes bacterium RBG_13_62_9]|nr:MAG: hypothetical protein A2Y77_16245 [Planctomycetes bacterium RBG_13_62_9]